MPEIRYDFQGGDVKRFALLKGRADKKVVTAEAYFLRHEARMCLEAVWSGVEFTLPAASTTGTPVDLTPYTTTAAFMHGLASDIINAANALPASENSRVESILDNMRQRLLQQAADIEQRLSD
jgi:hypothetical protein